MKWLSAHALCRDICCLVGTTESTLVGRLDKKPLRIYVPCSRAIYNNPLHQSLFLEHLPPTSSPSLGVGPRHEKMSSSQHLYSPTTSSFLSAGYFMPPIAGPLNWHATANNTTTTGSCAYKTYSLHEHITFEDGVAIDAVCALQYLRCCSGKG